MNKTKGCLIANFATVPVILFIVTLVVIALILITLLRWIQHLTSLGRVGETTA
ncbi:DUF2254 family protein, partial [Escherichia coli]|uniref:DUF2254 family protein n=1 Tax=Escherichia coli TaxID=562 RepID=UPI001BFDC6C8